MKSRVAADEFRRRTNFPDKKKLKVVIYCHKKGGKKAKQNIY